MKLIKITNLLPIPVYGIYHQYSFKIINAYNIFIWYNIIIITIYIYDLMFVKLAQPNALLIATKICYKTP